MAESINIGNVEVTCVLDMVPPPRPTTAMFPEVSESEWDGHQDALETDNSNCITQHSLSNQWTSL